MSSASSDFPSSADFEPPEADDNSTEAEITRARERLRQKASQATLPSLVRNHPYEAMAIALALGVLTGAGPRRAAQIARLVTGNLPLIMKFIR